MFTHASMFSKWRPTYWEPCCNYIQTPSTLDGLSEGELFHHAPPLFWIAGPCLGEDRSTGPRAVFTLFSVPIKLLSPFLSPGVYGVGWCMSSVPRGRADHSAFSFNFIVPWSTRKRIRCVCVLQKQTCIHSFTHTHTHRGVHTHTHTQYT